MQSKVERALAVAEYAKGLLSDEECFARGAFKREREGKPDAFCSLGAIAEATIKLEGAGFGMTKSDIYGLVCEELRVVVGTGDGGLSIAAWSDHATFKQVTDAFGDLCHRLYKKVSDIMICNCGTELDINMAIRVYDDQGIYAGRWCSYECADRHMLLHKTRADYAEDGEQIDEDY